MPRPDPAIANDGKALRRRERMGSTPRVPPRTPVRDALSSNSRSPCGVRRDRALARPASSRTRKGPFAGDRRCVHHHRRGFVARSPRGRPSLARVTCRYGDRRCVRPTSAHPRIRKRAPIVSCGDRVISSGPDALRRRNSTETGADGVSRHRARFGGSGSRGDRALSSRAPPSAALHL